MMRTSTLKLHSIRPKDGGGPALRVVDGHGLYAETVRASMQKEAAASAAHYGRDLRGFFLGVYDERGCFQVTYHVDGRVLPFWAAHEAFCKAIARVMNGG